MGGGIHVCPTSGILSRAGRVLFPATEVRAATGNVPRHPWVSPTCFEHVSYISPPFIPRADEDASGCIVKPLA